MRFFNQGRLVASRKHGIALVFTAGVLAILAAIGTAFFVLSQSSTAAAVRYSDMVRADLLCRAGLAEAIVRLRNQAYIKTEDPSDNWFTVDYLHGLQGRRSFPYGNGKDDDNDGILDNEGTETYQAYTRALGSSAGQNSDRFMLEVNDAASKINVNAGDNLAVILDNLCRLIGPPLVPAKLDALQPRRWAEEADAGDPVVSLYATTLNTNDTATNNDLYYTMTDESDGVIPGGRSGRPMRAADGTALYGDGYAIAGYRARYGSFSGIEDVKKALTWVERNGNGLLDDPLERLEIETKFVALKDHITVGSWVDTNTVCVGKFEWVHVDTGSGTTIAIDREKSWVIDDPEGDPLNTRGSLRGCYLSIMNGHGAGQLRRIHTNGIDWVEVEGGFAVTPGPISSYMIIAPEDSMLTDVSGTVVSYAYPDNPPPAGLVTLPQTNDDGTLVDNPNIDYSINPLCIHRAPVNINTATDKVLAALFLGLNVQHGHPQAVGTETEIPLLRAKWKTTDPQGVQPYLLTAAGLKRIPASSGKLILNKAWGAGPGEVQPPGSGYDLSYINNNDALEIGNWGSGSTGVMSEAQELAYRIVLARQTDRLQPTLRFIDPATGIATDYDTGVPRGPFRNYDDLYFRVIKPWDDQRFVVGAGKNAHLSTMLMANFNSNTDILKFNPNIEWIDRWSRNYTDQEPVMVYTNEPYPAGGIFTTDVPAATDINASSVPIYTMVKDAVAWGTSGKGNVIPLKSSQKKIIPPATVATFIPGAYLTRTFRYKSDELIDKTDLNRSTTEFSFDSNGTFQVTSSGQIINVSTGQLLAERKMETLVKVYDVWRESTQQQFVMGTISAACGDRRQSRDKAHMSCTGQLARDVTGLVERKGLVTLPEPLLPLKAKIVNINGNVNTHNKEAVTDCDTKTLATGVPLDAFGNPRKNPYDSATTSMYVPEVLANRVLPARWDGQLALSTNTSSFDPSYSVSSTYVFSALANNGDDDTFLASFDGDTDTADCLGNGREQAKWPYSAEPDGSGGYRYTGKGHKYRCLQSIGLLGILNDTMISTDPGLPLVDGTTPFDDAADMSKVRWVYPFYGISNALKPLSLGADPDRPMYWNNVSVRMGSLRTDGVYLTAPGVSGNTATLKYLFSSTTSTAAISPYSPWTGAANVRRNMLNYQPDSKFGNTITMWTKTVWHQDDMRHHEFFNPSNTAKINSCMAFFFAKMGQYRFTASDNTAGGGHCTNRNELNDLGGIMTGNTQSGWGSYLHGGYAFINANASTNTESPAYRIQPFRWSFVGLRTHPVGLPSRGDPPYWPGYFDGVKQVGHLTEVNSGTYKGITQITSNQAIIRHYMRPIIDTALLGEGPGGTPQYWPTMPFTGPRIGAYEVQPVWPSSAYPSPTSTNPLNGCNLRWGYQGYCGWGYFSGCRYYYGQPRDTCGTGVATTVTNPNPLAVGRGETAAGGNGSAWIYRAGEGQDAKWVWAEPYGTSALDPNKTTSSLKSFGINNLNYGNPVYNQAFDPTWETGTTSLVWHYRNMPEDGTYAVIDEFKISARDRVLVYDENSDWDNDRAYREMRTSRYYLPPSPGSRLNPENGGPPTFTSQTLFQSLRGRGVTATPISQEAIVVRASWNVFTPRFMCEYQEAPVSPFSRNERITRWSSITQAQTSVNLKFKGPFDYVKYNNDADTSVYSVNRPAPWAYTSGISQANRGVEIELLDDTTPLVAKQQDSSGVFQDAALNPVTNTTSVLTNPAMANRFGDLLNPVRVRVDKLHYRVRFRYPVDPLVDPSITTTDVDGNPCIDTTKQMMLDTPVFDDMSVTYMLPARILDFHEVTE